MPGEDFQKTIETCGEAQLYLIIDGLGYLVWRMRHNTYRDEGRGYVSKSDADATLSSADKTNKQCELAVRQTARFGIDPVFAKRRSAFAGGEIDAPSDAYWAWYNWWKEYISALPEDEFRLLDKTIGDKGDVSKWRPQGDWRARLDVMVDSAL